MIYPTDWVLTTLLTVATITGIGWFIAVVHVLWLLGEYAKLWLARRLGVDPDADGWGTS